MIPGGIRKEKEVNALEYFILLETTALDHVPLQFFPPYFVCAVGVLVYIDFSYLNSS